MKKSKWTIRIFIITAMLSVVDLLLSLQIFSNFPTFETNPLAQLIFEHSEHPFLIVSALKAVSFLIYGWIVLRFRHHWSGFITSVIGLLILAGTMITWLLFPFSIFG